MIHSRNSDLNFESFFVNHLGTFCLGPRWLIKAVFLKSFLSSIFRLFAVRFKWTLSLLLDGVSQKFYPFTICMYNIRKQLTKNTCHIIQAIELLRELNKFK
jgi:hypothetical protein